MPIDMTEAAVAGILDEYDLVEGRCLRFSSMGRMSLWCGCSAMSARGCLLIADMLYKDDRTLTADADFLDLSAHFDSVEAPDDTYYESQWHLDQIDALEAWQMSTGSTDITIAIVDSGVDLDHEDLLVNLIPGMNLYSEGEPDDTFRHGTAVAGVASAVTDNATGVAGVAWECQIMPVKIGNIPPWSSSIEAAGINWAYEHGADIILCCFGSETNHGIIWDAIINATWNGVIVVASIGNEDYPVPIYPAHYEEVIAVGATDQYDNRVIEENWESNPDDSLDVVAPGIDIYTTDIATWGFGYDIVEAYANPSGTSFSAPIVAGLAALILSATADENGEKTLTRQEVQALIQFSADDLVGDVTEDTQGRDEYMGFGRVNAAAALDLAGRAHFELTRGNTIGHYFDSEGNYYVKGYVHTWDSWLTTDWWHTPTCRIKSASTEVAMIANSGGSEALGKLRLVGRAWEKVSGVLTPAGDAFIIQNDAGVNVAYIDEDGNLFLKGYIFAAKEPDSRHD